MSTLTNKYGPSVALAIGRRKTAVVKVKLVTGSGEIQVNKKPGDLYFQFNSQYIRNLKSPLTALGLEDAFDLFIDAKGGGLSGQTDAAKLAISRALCHMSHEKRPLLKKEQYLTRDYRSKERKKYGLRKARKAPQFSKR
uniref:ribosomal protein S9 n=1 Tax=Ochrosphaera neapolitana TaxID=35137 RepID=UPI00286C87E9|nr:ribosomal protein S9 [Ochrosphaera neapolitana]WKK50118.1 ribosomal protein S9 [Ochrosphaera neapolitana]